MKREVCLLDAMQSWVGCENLSDLHWLDDIQRLRLSHKLEKLPPDAASLFEWNDALGYLTRQPPEETAQAARGRLIRMLSVHENGI